MKEVDHAPVVRRDHMGVLTCAVCGKAVRTAVGGKYVVHAKVV